MGTDIPFMEVRGSALGTDIDRIGEKILIFADRVEVRDRNHTVRQTIPYDELASVEVQKKIMGPSLVITSVGGATMQAKALRPELASGAKAMIDKHAARFLRGEGVGAKSTDDADEMQATSADRSVTAAPDAGSGVVAPLDDERTADLTHEPAAASPGTAPTPSEMPGSDSGAAAPLRVPGAPGTQTHRFVLIAMLEELHDAGILSTAELEAKKALIEMTDRSR